MFRGVRVGVGRCCPTPLVVSARLKGGRLRRDHCSGCSRGIGGCLLTPLMCSTGLKGGWWRRDHVSGCSRGGRQVFADPVCSFGGAQGRAVAPRSCFPVFEGGETQVLSYPACSLGRAQGLEIAPRSRFGLFEWAVARAKPLIRSTSTSRSNSHHDQHGPHRRARQDTHPDHAQPVPHKVPDELNSFSVLLCEPLAPC